MTRHLFAAAALALLAACGQAPAAQPTSPPPEAPSVTAEAAPAPVADPYEPRPYVEITSPDWAKDAVIYQINTRQFTPEGTFRAAQAQLPRLQELGVDILWLMPIHPIGELNRKGTLGSPYSVKDYFAVNPEFGTLEDLKAFVEDAHARGMHVILDWVANHTAWDNPMASDHPDWYERDPKGEFVSTPWWDWADIIDLNYDRRDLREYMTRALKYWVEEVGIDGYRADVAGFVPMDFWEQVRAELDAIKPVFLLAEFDQRDAHRRAFDATYAWGWNNAMHDIATKGAGTGAVIGYYATSQTIFPREAMRLMHVENHDQNSWDGTMFERFGPALEAAIVLSFTGEGIPMIYNGQEAGNEKRLQFFERDPIAWRDHPIGDLYKRLIDLKTANSALWNGVHGAKMWQVVNSAPNQVLSFIRQHGGGDGVFVALNLSASEQTVTFERDLHHGAWTDAFSGEAVTVDGATELTLPAWGYRVFAR